MNYDEQSVLDATYLNGMFNERKRIIALLETEATNFSEYCTLPLDEEHCQMCNQYVRLIALIKGDGK